MGEKDITKKTLEAYNDVFADIVNVLLFNGEQLIRPEDLVDQTPRSVYKADDKIREIERDVAKRWIKNNIRIACIGLENQTMPDPYMPLRVMGYDGVEYRNQLRDLKKWRKACCSSNTGIVLRVQGTLDCTTFSVRSTGCAFRSETIHHRCESEPV